MQIICISEGSCSRGKELAESLAVKLGCRCLGREEMVEEATKAGIAVGKLEALMLRPNRYNERLVVEKEHYHAFVTSFLCRHALDSDLVYHGRAGHFLLPGVSHVLRIRVVEELDRRVNSAMSRLNVSREKAIRYLQQVDDDMRRWVKTFYDADWDTTQHFDLVVNLDQMSAANAATALCAMAELPDFQTTPASRQAMENLHLAARVRLDLARDEHTRNASFRVVADRGSVLVTYQPRDARVSEFVPAVARRTEDVTELRCTMAATSILWIQEEYDAASESYSQIVELARRWNAAVELMRFVPGGGDGSPPERVSVETLPETPPPSQEYDGGIEDDIEVTGDGEDGGLRVTHDRLARDGVAGGARSVCCGSRRLLESLDGRAKYTLVVIGEVFLGQDASARVRKTRELASSLSESLRIPAVGVDELKKAYLFTPGQVVRLFFYMLAAGGLLALVLLNQDVVLRLTHVEGTWAKVLAAVGVTLIIPSFAFLYGTLTKNLLRLMRIE